MSVICSIVSWSSAAAWADTSATARTISEGLVARLSRLVSTSTAALAAATDDRWSPRSWANLASLTDARVSPRCWASSSHLSAASTSIATPSPWMSFSAQLSIPTAQFFSSEAWNHTTASLSRPRDASSVP
jgi:hypothetical protein